MRLILPGLTNHEEMVLDCLNRFRATIRGYNSIGSIYASIRKQGKNGIPLKVAWVHNTLMSLANRGFVLTYKNQEWKLAINKMGTALYKMKSPGGKNGRS